jgi:hypothetical protein
LVFEAGSFSERRQMKTFRLFLAQYLPLGGSSAILLGLLCAIGLWFSAPKMAFAQSSAQRDQEALTILSQAIAAGGGQELLASVRDFTETGTVTYSLADQDTGNVTVKSRGLHQFRIDADLANGRRTTVVNGGGGSLKEADGRRWPIYRQSAADLGSFTLPYLPLIGAMQDSSVSIVYGGLIIHNGASAYDIRLRRAYTKRQDPSGNRGLREARDFYIDPKTLLVSAISDRIHFGGGTNDEGVPHEILYSNYQAENGVMAPMAVVETARGVTGLKMNFSQVKFNSGSSDSDFAW